MTSAFTNRESGVVRVDFDGIRKYWDERAASDSSAQSTTRDFYFRDIEHRVLRLQIALHQPRAVFDIGCGDARTTARLAANFPHIAFTGGDYAPAMLTNARAVVARAGIGNLALRSCDVLDGPVGFGLDFIYTTRCLINLPTTELQQQALRNIAASLRPGGIYVMIENFIEGHDNFNSVREEFGLSPIAVHDHNHFFSRRDFVETLDPSLKILADENISSTYYLASRVIYSRLCSDEGVAPDYFDAHHRYAAQLPFAGEYGPTRMTCLQRK